jgi:hypothetical protein
VIEEAMPDFARHRCVYMGHLLSHAPVRMPDGRHRARVVITALEADCTIGQRFLDLDVLDLEAEAAEQGLKAGKAWVEEQMALARSR